jgi:hypothetical protein
MSSLLPTTTQTEILTLFILAVMVGKMVLKCILGWKVMDWMHLAQYGAKWLAVVNTAMKLRVA